MLPDDVEANLELPGRFETSPANLSLLQDPDLKVRTSAYMLLKTYSMWSYDDVAEAEALAWFTARKIPRIIANYWVKVHRYQSMVTKQYRLKMYVNGNKEQVLDERIVHLLEPPLRHQDIYHAWLGRLINAVRDATRDTIDRRRRGSCKERITANPVGSSGTASRGATSSGDDHQRHVGRKEGDLEWRRYQRARIFEELLEGDRDVVICYLTGSEVCPVINDEHDTSATDPPWIKRLSIDHVRILALVWGPINHLDPPCTLQAISGSRPGTINYQVVH